MTKSERRCQPFQLEFRSSGDIKLNPALPPAWVGRTKLHGVKLSIMSPEFAPGQIAGNAGIDDDASFAAARSSGPGFMERFYRSTPAPSALRFLDGGLHPVDEAE